MVLQAVLVAARDELGAATRDQVIDETPAVAMEAAGGTVEVVSYRLAGLEFLDVFLAVRDLHAAIKTDGESPARLAALSRGYALLGVLSEFQWHRAHRAFKARALLCTHSG